MNLNKQEKNFNSQFSAIVVEKKYNTLKVNFKHHSFKSNYVKANQKIFQIENDGNLQPNKIQMNQNSKNTIFQSVQHLCIEEFTVNSIHQISKIKIIVYLEGKNKCPLINKKSLIKKIKQSFTYINHNQYVFLHYLNSLLLLNIKLQKGKKIGYISDKTSEWEIEKGIHQKFDFTQLEIQKILENQNQEINPEQFLKNDEKMVKYLKKRIGGHDDKLDKICQRIFSSRTIGKNWLEKLGIQHVRGLLLHGPPGTGKTLIARQISKISPNPPTIINGPEIMDKFVGQSQRKLRQPFDRARNQQNQKGHQSSLHIIIFDQFDALCRKRGSASRETGVNDSLVGQLLTCMDGVQSLNNIFVIGITNRKDMIDPAMLRPGRMELDIQISLPDLEGRKKIFDIHSQKMRNFKLIHQDVDFMKLAILTQNFTGAEIQSVIRIAFSIAFHQWKTHQKYSEQLIGITFFIQMKNFVAAIKECTPQFGFDNKLLSKLIPQEYHKFSQEEQYIKKLSYIMKKLKIAKKGKFTVLINGPSGVGKTTQAALLANKIECFYTKIISSDNFIGLSQEEKNNQIVQIFNDGQKCHESCVILDDLVRLTQYIPMGSKFNNIILQNIINIVKKHHKEDKKVIIIATANNDQCVKDLGLTSLFQTIIDIPYLGKNNIIAILRKISVNESIIQDLSKRNDISIRELLNILPVDLQMQNI